MQIRKIMKKQNRTQKLGQKNRVPVYLVEEQSVNKLLSLVIHPGRVYSVATKRPQAEDSLGTL